MVRPEVDIGDRVIITGASCPPPPEQWLGIRGQVIRDYGDGTVMIDTGSNKMMVSKNWLQRHNNENII